MDKDWKIMNLIDEFNEFVKEKKLELSNYELCHMNAIITLYPATAPKPSFSYNEFPIEFCIEAIVFSEWHGLCVSAPFVSYWVDGCEIACSGNEYTVFAVITKFFKAIQSLKTQAELVLEEFKELVKERDLKLSDYQLFYWRAVLESYPKTAPYPSVDIDTYNDVCLNVKTNRNEYELIISASYIAYVDDVTDDFKAVQSGEDGHTEYSVITKFFKAIQNG